MEKMNIIDILRGCPEGTKLYSLVHGEVELTRVGVEDIYCKPSYLNHELSFNSDGRWVENLGECILFPSKENRNWSTFKRPFKDGDIIYNPGIKATAIFYKQTNDHTISHCFLNILGEFKIHHYHCKSLFDWRFASEKEKEILFKTIEDNGYRWNPETKTLDSKFKDGDVVFYSNTIAIFKEWGDETLFRTYCTFYTTVSNPTYQFEISRPLFGKGIRREARFATLEEKEKFFEVIRDNGYRWNTETKTLEKLPKFKDGDILFAKAAYSWILIYKDSENKEDIYKYVAISTNPNHKFIVYDKNPLCCKEDVSEIRLASAEEKEKLFEVIRDNGYCWNVGAKTLEKLPKFKVGDVIRSKKDASVNISNILITKVNERSYSGVIGDTTNVAHINFKYQDQYELIPSKFDINTLKLFDKVLVRNDSSETWHIQFFENYNRQYGAKYPFTCMCDIKYSQCIPFKGNEHLANTANDCCEYFKTWEFCQI